MTVRARKRVVRAVLRWSGFHALEVKDRTLLVRDAREDPRIRVTARIVELPTLPSGLPSPLAAPTFLILQLAHIGDFVLSLRALKKLRDGFPASRITLVCASWNAEWAATTGLVDEVIAFDFFPRLNRDWSGPRESNYARFEELKLGAYDLAIDLRHDGDTRPCLYRVAAKVRAGYLAPLEPGLPAPDLVLPPVEFVQMSDGLEFSLHAELRYDLLADAVVNAFAEPRPPHPAAAIWGPRSGGGTRPYVVLAVGAGDPIRRWPSACFIALARAAIERFDADILVVGGGTEAEVVTEIVAGLPSRASGHVDLPLTTLAARLAGALAVVGLGSGASHLAASLGVPTITLLSGVSPLDVWRTVGPRAVNLHGETPCAPCWLKEAADCPFGVTCLRSLTPELVLGAMERLIRPG